MRDDKKVFKNYNFGTILFCKYYVIILTKNYIFLKYLFADESWLKLMVMNVSNDVKVFLMFLLTTGWENLKH